MLQFRMKGSTGQFYNPQRDMVYCWPRALRAALVAFDTFEGDAKCSKQEMLDAATALALATSEIIDQPTMPEKASALMKSLDAQFPNAMAKIQKSLFHTVFGVFTGWTMDVRPKASDDQSIPTLGLDELAERMARESVKCAEDKRNI